GRSSWPRSRATRVSNGSGESTISAWTSTWRNHMLVFNSTSRKAPAAEARDPDGRSGYTYQNDFGSVRTGSSPGAWRDEVRGQRTGQQPSRARQKNAAEFGQEPRR